MADTVAASLAHSLPVNLVELLIECVVEGLTEVELLQSTIAEAMVSNVLHKSRGNDVHWMFVEFAVNIIIFGCFAL